MIVGIRSLEDARVGVYRNLKDGEVARVGGRFIAEGELVVKRLLASDFPVESVLVTERRVEEIAPLVREDVPVYVAVAGVVNQIVGFKFHSGVIACGHRKPRMTVGEMARGWGKEERITVVVCPQIANTENLGSLVRISAALGAAGMVLGEQCCDPFYRQAIRVSMGSVFSLPIAQSERLIDDLGALRREHGFELAACVLDESAEKLAGARRGKRLGILLGNEAQGLEESEVAACDRKVMIPMSMGTDSLNVSVAAGIILYHFVQVA